MWNADYSLERIDIWYDGDDDHHIILDPDFQRGHVWTKDQQVAFVEYVLRGGKHSLSVIFNQPSLNSVNAAYTCVDGLQRLTAIHKFMHDELKVFDGRTCTEMCRAMKRTHGRFPWTKYSFKVNVVHIDSKAELLRFYLELNEGGTPHSKEELDRVHTLLKRC